MRLILRLSRSRTSTFLSRSVSSSMFFVMLFGFLLLMVICGECFCMICLFMVCVMFLWMIYLCMLGVFF